MADSTDTRELTPPGFAMGDAAGALAMLEWLASLGAADPVLETPQCWLADAPSTQGDAPSSVPEAQPAAIASSVRRTAPPKEPASDSGSLAEAQRAAAAAQSLAELREAMARFDGTNLKAGARNLVFADGNSQAPLMLVGEAPGRDEDLAGLPFVGASGQLLDRILAAAGLDRTKVYITNVLPWRPPDNREPSLTEAALFLPFLKRHIALVRPRIVLALGATSMRHLFDTTEGITRMRGKWQELLIEDNAIPAMATFHPAALLRNALNKRFVWRDMLEVSARLGMLDQKDHSTHVTD
ncbi:MAG TPA: uracil-DNA glycosylase [Micropepsaceae bacterium]|nr:uracil-DNA glycosylase [Micropepsaceae bacterium]